MKFDDINPLQESSLSRIQGKIADGACGAITAYRGEYTKRENQQRNKSLLAKLMQAGYSVTSVKGSYIENYNSEDGDQREVSEHSFFVSSKTSGDDGGKLEDFLVGLGEAFDQDSILSIPFGADAVLVGTSQREDSYPPYGQRASVGRMKGGKVGEFMTRVGNRPFVMEHTMPSTINGKRGLKMLAEMDWREVLLKDD